MSRHFAISVSRVLLASTLLATQGCGEPTAVVVEVLRVVNWSPGPGAVCVGVDTSIFATFSDDLAEETLTADSFLLEAPSGALQLSPVYDEATFTAELTPDTVLDYDTIYSAVAKEGLKGKNTGVLLTDLRASFRTVPRGGCTAAVECTIASDCAQGGQRRVCSTDGQCRDCLGDGDCLFAYGQGSICQGGECSVN